jgi:hypothetical protein
VLNFLGVLALKGPGRPLHRSIGATKAPAPAGGDRRIACPTKKSARRAKKSRSCNTKESVAAREEIKIL